MAKVLVVDDSAMDRQLAGNLLQKRSGLTAAEKATGLIPIYANDGKEALALIDKEKPDLILTDLQMPEMNGLELVEEVRSKYRLLPVIIMTAHGSEEIAIQALQKGAASYVPKRHLARDLLETVEGVLAATTAEKGQQRVLECLTQTESHFLLDNDPSLITPLFGHLEQDLARMKLCDENGLIRVAVALREALINAIHHGNLEVSSQLLETEERAYHRLVEERRRLKPYRDRRVHIVASVSPAKATYSIRDEGNGFDPSLLPDPTDPANLEKPSGRGLLLIRTFMDEVNHNAVGNEITMTKRRD